MSACGINTQHTGVRARSISMVILGGGVWRVTRDHSRFFFLVAGFSWNRGKKFWPLFALDGTLKGGRRVLARYL